MSPMKKVEVKLVDLKTKEIIAYVRVNNWTNALYLKERVYEERKYPVKEQRLLYKNMWLANNKELQEYGVFDEGECESLVYVGLTPSYDRTIGGIEIISGPTKMTSDMELVIMEIRQGLNAKVAPELTIEGTCGTYFLKNAERFSVGVYKPIDEEAFAPNNPRKLQGAFGSPSCRKGVLSGEACVREIAAYLVDYKGFSGVPETVFAAVSHPGFSFCGEETCGIAHESKLKKEIEDMVMPASVEHAMMEGRGQVKYGSLQKYESSSGVAEDFSETLFSDDEVHKIAILDIRILNADRHSSNILVKKYKVEVVSDGPKAKKKEQIGYKLIPIDHGMSLPSTLDLCEMEYCWLSWEHKDRPFSEKTLSYIKSIDVDKDIETLKSQFKFRPICLRNMKLSCTLLKKGAAAGLTLGEIGKIWCRTDDEGEVPSVFERVVDNARRQADIVKEIQKKSISSLYSTPKKASVRKGSILTYSDKLLAESDIFDKLKNFGEPTEESKVVSITRRGRSNTESFELSPELVKEKSEPTQILPEIKEKLEEEEKTGGLLSVKVKGLGLGFHGLEDIKEEEVFPVHNPLQQSEFDQSIEDSPLPKPVLKRTASIPGKLSGLATNKPRLRVIKRNGKMVKPKAIVNSNGNIRDTVQDSDFFYYFGQFLEYEIAKLKEGREKAGQ